MIDDSITGQHYCYLMVAPPVAAIVLSLENASLKQMTKHLARMSPQHTLLVVTRRVRVCRSLTSSIFASINIHIVSTTYLAPLPSSTCAVISLWITWRHRFTTLVSLVSHPWRKCRSQYHKISALFLITCTRGYKI